MEREHTGCWFVLDSVVAGLAGLRFDDPRSPSGLWSRAGISACVSRLMTTELDQRDECDYVTCAACVSIMMMRITTTTTNGYGMSENIKLFIVFLPDDHDTGLERARAVAADKESV